VDSITSYLDATLPNSNVDSPEIVQARKNIPKNIKVFFSDNANSNSTINTGLRLKPGVKQIIRENPESLV